MRPIEPSSRRRRDRARDRRPPMRPRFDRMEDRLLLATVTNAQDVGPGSLRQAISDTDAGPAGGTVAFDIVRGAISEAAIPTPASQPSRIAAGPDGALWFTENAADQIGRINVDGTIAEFPIPTAASMPFGITSGPDGNLWFAENRAGNIGRITPAGVITEFAPQGPAGNPDEITAGPDGNLWFTDLGTSEVGRITTAGVITEFPLPTPNSRPTGITAGPDGNLWFVEGATDNIGRITTAGVATEFPIPTAAGGPSGITSGPDGNLWFTETAADKVGRITTAGAFSEFPIPTAGSRPVGIAAGSDGSLWFTEITADKVGRITTAGVVTESRVPTAASRPAGITPGPDGSLWFTEFDGDRIGRVNASTSTTIGPQSPLPTITVPATVDGDTQPGFAGRPLVAIAGTNAGPGAAGLTIGPAGVGSTIRGLSVVNFSRAGIRLIGGGDTIEGDDLGTDGTLAMGNGTGIELDDSSNNTIGGPTPSARDVISGNHGAGILILGSGRASFNVIRGNDIGTADGGNSPLGNATAGIAIRAIQPGQVGGTGDVILDNIIAGNLDTPSGTAAVGVDLSGATDTLLMGNRIGLDAAGLALGNQGAGLTITSAAAGATVGGTAAGAGNLISANGADGIFLDAAHALILGNRVGTDPAGKVALGNLGAGLAVGPNASLATIGGTAAGAGNVLSGNRGDGLSLASTSALGALVQGNLVGVDASGESELPDRGDGIAISGSPGDTIGGTAAGAGNVISGNLGDGVLIAGAGSTGDLVQANSIGTDLAGLAHLGNALAGLAIVGGATGDAVLGNAILANGRLGIDLGADGVTPNDPGDADAGPDQLQNFPILASAVISGGTTTIRGTLGSRPGGVYRIEFFRSLQADPSGFGQGGRSLGESTVTTDGSGNASFSFASPVPAAGQLITATATSISSDQGADNTSEFSAAFPVLSMIPPVPPSLSIGDVAGPEGNSGFTKFVFTIALSSPSTVPVSVRYSTADGTATAAEDDYVPAAGTLTFPPGVTSRTITVGVVGDTVYEPDETFAVDLSGPVNATILDAQAVGTILNDDPPPVVRGGTVVFNTDDAGPGSLRQAILDANLDPGQTISFAIPPRFRDPSGGLFTIIPVTPLPAITAARTVVDGSTQASFEGLPASTIAVQVDGAATAPSDGLVFAPGSTGGVLRGLSVFGFGASQVRVESDGASIVGDDLGIPADPAARALLATASSRGTADPGSDGIAILGAGATVGGLAASDRDVISGNRGQGVQFIGPGAGGGVVIGDFIGLDPTGTLAMGNRVDGIVVGGGAGGLAIVGNVVSGNADIGIELLGSSGNLVVSNEVGTDAPGRSAVPNGGSGICVDLGSSANTIGGTSPLAGNLVSGNGVVGIAVRSGSDGNFVEGNRVGTDASGTMALGNAVAGVLVLDSSANAIGPGNLVSANGSPGRPGAGIWVDGPAPGPGGAPISAGNLVDGDRVGVDASGSRALGNTSIGILIDQSSGNRVGGPDPGSSNLISGNGSIGLAIAGPSASANAIQGNRIGVDASGSRGLGNGPLDGGGVGLYLLGAAGNLVGGPGPDEGNLVSANGTGVELFGPEATGNVFMGNRVGTDAPGLAGLGNVLDGIVLDRAPSNQFAGNLIAANGRNGVFLSGSAGNVLRANAIGLGAGGRPLANGGFGILIGAGSSGTVDAANLKLNNRLGPVRDAEAPVAGPSPPAPVPVPAHKAAAKARHVAKVHPTPHPFATRPTSAFRSQAKGKARR